MTKRFETDVGASLTKLGVYRHKCPDTQFGVPDKVDYSTISVDGSGWRCELEAKETETSDRFPFAAAGGFTPNQTRVLTDVNLQGGLAVGLVNFGRRPDQREAGVVGVFRWPFLPNASVPDRYAHPWLYIHEGLNDPRLRRGAPPSSFLEDAELILEREVGRTWPLQLVLQRAFWANLR